MTTECSVCLEPYKNAVSVPCGHLFCSACLQKHISKDSVDGVNAKCPMCQKVFTFLTPDLTLVMKPFHKHIHSSIRKVYVDVNHSEMDKLKAELAEAKTQMQELKKSETGLKKALGEEKQSSSRLRRQLEDTGRLKPRIPTVTAGSSSSLAPLAKKARNSVSQGIPRPVVRGPNPQRMSLS